MASTGLKTDTDSVDGSIIGPNRIESAEDAFNLLHNQKENPLAVVQNRLLGL